MREAIPTELLLRLMNATPEQYAAVERILGMGADAGLGEATDGTDRTNANTARADGGSATGNRPIVSNEVAWQNSFRCAGSHWDVGFGGGAAFHVEDSLGARYLDHLLHRPGEVISAFDLEVAICPEKGQSRSRDSIQLQLDPETARSYLRELTRLRAERERANEHGDEARAEQHDEEIAALEEALQGNGHTTSDTGERARNNVRKAVRKLIARLERGGRSQRALAAHLAQCVSLGFQVSYQPTGGEVWD